MGDEEDTEQKDLNLSALVAPSERKISRISLRKTSGIGEDYVDVIVDPFPALPINIRVPSMRKKSTADETTQSTTNILMKYVTHCEEDRLKQWERLEVLPDTDATAALAQLVLDHKESIKPDADGAKKVGGKLQLEIISFTFKLFCCLALENSNRKSVTYRIDQVVPCLDANNRKAGVDLLIFSSQCSENGLSK
ncbi:unnamed protein product [Strongylus vulgaris]|uniref:Uncharacterized protein n=1 Tax=Strongylus vulgaris TaxID=40348 RepID=A0A3P7JME1_STRVU|nr:unnamed protein product [Strongylus vulgaris]